MKKGQYFSFDAIVASVIFVLAVVSLLSYWSSIRTSLDFQNSAASRESVRISEALLSQGTPKDVSCSNMKRLGFANSNKRINWSIVLCAEVEAQNNGNYLKERLGTGYNVTIKFERDDGSEVVVGRDVDDQLIREVKNIHKLRRIVSLDTPEDELVYLDIFLYR